MGLGLKTLESLLNASMGNCDISQFSRCDITTFLIMIWWWWWWWWFTSHHLSSLQWSKPLRCHSRMLYSRHDLFNVSTALCSYWCTNVSTSTFFTLITHRSWMHVKLVHGHTLRALHLCLAVSVYFIWRDTHAYIRKTTLHIWLRHRTVCGC